MDRVIVTGGTKTSLYQLFEDLQDYTQDNIQNWLFSMMESFGVMVQTTPEGNISSLDTSLQVTYYDANHVEVSAGEAITSGLCFIDIPDTILSTSTLSDGPHYLYAQHTYIQDTPVPVQSGFTYGMGTTSNSREHDSYQFVWDTNPLVSGVLLAQVTTFNGHPYNNIVDMRSTNILKFKPTMVHTQNTDSGTTSAFFRVGNSSISADDGSLVMLVPSTPMVPKNVRIVDVYPSTISSTRLKAFDAQLAATVRTGLISHTGTISLKWNYDDVQGAGGVPGTGQFEITNSGGSKTWAIDELVGYHLWLTGVSKDYVITANLATSNTDTVLTVAPYGHSVPVDGYTATANQPAWIHSNATSYELLITPLQETGVPVPNERYEDIVKGAPNGLPALQDTMDLFLGEQVAIQIRAVQSTITSAYATMPAGNYTKQPPFVTIQDYDSNFLMQLPGLNSQGVKIGANTTTTGFTITIVGWELATDYEICYTTNAAGPNFLDPTQEVFTTRQNSVDIPTSTSSTYYIAVRPLMVGQAVADAQVTSVVSGAGNNAIKGNTVFFSNVSVKTYGGQLGAYDGVTYQGYATTSIYSPADSASRLVFPGQAIWGKTMTVGGIDYSIDEVIPYGSTTYIRLFDSNGNENTGLGTPTFTINTSQQGRIIGTTYFNQDVILVSISVAQKSKGYTNGTPVLRWYQLGQAGFGDSLTLLSPGVATYSQPTDVTILQQNGNQTLIVDLYDPSNTDNHSGFVGDITIVWKPYTSTGRTTDNIQTSFTQVG